MRKYVLAIAAVIGMTSVAHADWNNHNRRHYHGGGGCYNCYNNRGGGDPGLALFGGLVGGMIIGGMIANSNQGYYYQPMCQTVFMGRVFDGWRWVDRYERVCQ